MPKEAVFTVQTGNRTSGRLHGRSRRRRTGPHRKSCASLWVSSCNASARRGEHDTWFRAEVRRALEDPRRGIPQDAVMDETQAIVDRIAHKRAGA